ncbi:MAG: division/cell wall cluster transcriptional repressor MraZ [Alphaproteobacteria bacterium]|nr:division/cell wall cluster transcriptional repressor MraZ [Alphaproteobacteria bacterium]MBL0718037.1 division/cell wall cluster transcriptional repressor MraZ [Alphaproteobacteria bacterium]
MLFLSKFNASVDKKCRVSVPASFRSVVAEDSFAGVVIFPSTDGKHIVGCSMKRMEEISTASEQQVGIFSTQADSIQQQLFAQARPLAFDVNGRILLPLDIVQRFRLDDSLIFVGLGKFFHIWNENQYEKYTRQQKKTALPTIKIQSER